MSVDWVDVLVGVLGIAVALYLYRLTRTKRRIVWRIVSKQRLIRMKEAGEFGPDLEVTVGGYKLQNPVAIEVEILNAGTVGLDIATMRNPLTVRAHDGYKAYLLNFEKIPAPKSSAAREVFPSTVSGREEDSPNLVAAVLLNRGDRLLCKLVVDGEDGEVLIEGAAENFNIVQAKRSQQEDWAAKALVPLLLGIMTPFAVIAVVLLVGLVVAFYNTFFVPANTPFISDGQ